MAKVKIVAKIRPFIDGEEVDDALYTEGSVLSLIDPRNEGQRIQYTDFAACYDASKTAVAEDLFETEIEPLLGSALEGKTVAILCYGVTSSGKTTTLQGNDQNPGIIPRSVESLLAKQSTSQFKYTYQVRYFEIYSDECYDLLVPRSHIPTKLTIRDGEDGKVEVRPLEVLECTTLQQFKKLLSKATKSRTTASTSFNRNSSRSHAILSINISQSPFGDDPSGSKRHALGEIQFVDLAGSESNKNANKAGEGSKDRKFVGPKSAKDRFAESVSINTSLSTLRRVVQALNKNTGVVPYRESSLTRVLKEALGGNSETVLICNIAPGKKWLNHTRTTIEFATEAKSIKTTPNAAKEEESKRKFEEFRSRNATINKMIEEEVAQRVAQQLAALTSAQSSIAPGPIPPSDATIEEVADSSMEVEVKPEPKEVKFKSEPKEVKIKPEPKVKVKSEPKVQSEPIIKPEPIDVDLTLDAPLEGSRASTAIPEPMPDLDRTLSQLSVVICSAPRLNATARVPETIEEAVEAPLDIVDYGAPEDYQDEPPMEPEVQPDQPSERTSIPELLKVEHLHVRQTIRTAEEERDRFRRKLNKGLEEKHAAYMGSDKKVNRGKFARACIIAGKMALDEKGDTEFAITMFQKAISWYPENERLLEETLNLKKRLREERGIPDPPKPSKKPTTNPLSSTRIGNSRTASTSSTIQTRQKARRPLFDPEVDGPALEVKQVEKKEKSKPSKKVEVPSKGKGKSKGKSRPAMEAAAAAFADSASEEEGASADEVEKSLIVEEPESPPVKKDKGKGRAKKRKSDEDDYVEREERPVKRSRRPLF